MTLRMENEKYDKLLNILRKSKPVLNSTEEIEREVLKSISQKHKTYFNLPYIADFLFGWIYIGWVRRSLIVASVVMVLVFVWQQGVIMKQINYLSRQTIIIDGGPASDPADVIGKRIMMYKLSVLRFPSRTITISEKQMNQLLDSVNELQIKYKDLINLIKEDPEMKKYIEEKLVKNSRTKIKL